jgi:hypothetical protein
MSIYFTPDGKINFKTLTLVTAAIGTTYIFSFVLGVSPVTDTSSNAVNNQGITKDWLLYSRVKPAKTALLAGKVVAIKNPYTNKVIFRRIIATELQWIRRSDDMGLI